MRIRVFAAALALAGVASAGGPGNFARQWPVLGSCGPGAPPGLVSETSINCEGAFAVALDESLYRQVAREDMSDIAAFNADGETLAFGPMPASLARPPGTWRKAAWFALPAGPGNDAQDLHLHVTRSAAGDLNLDASLSRGIADELQDVLLDVRAPDRQVDAIALELAMGAADFTTQVSVEASDDLQQWRTVVPAASIAQLRQGGQSLVRRHIEFAPVSATYLRLHSLGATGGIPLAAVELKLHPQAPPSESIQRSSTQADFVRREGRAFVYELPARAPVERVEIQLGDDNAVANFSVSAREPGERNWRYIGQMSAFRLRGAGVSLDNEAMDIGMTRQREWRIESSIDLDEAPRLVLSWRPERWLLLTHGKPPFVVAAGSHAIQRGAFPLDALVATVRNKFGPGWQPTPAVLGKMQTAGGEAALTAYDPARKRTWLLWSLLVFGAAVIAFMVIRLLKAPTEP